MYLAGKTKCYCKTNDMNVKNRGLNKADILTSWREILGFKIYKNYVLTVYYSYLLV